MPENYICPDWEGDEESLYLMNNPSYSNDINAYSNIVMKILICDDHTEKFEDDSIWDGYEEYKDIGWGYRREDEPECMSPELIKEFLEDYEPTL